MQLEISVAEVTAVFKEIHHGPEKLFEMIRQDIRHTIENYLSALMNADLIHRLGRKPFRRCQGDINNRNRSYSRHYNPKRTR